MDFVHVQDVASAVVAALDSERSCLPINVGTGVQTTVAQLAEILIKAVGADVEPIFKPRDVLVSRRAADITRARDVLGWDPEISVEVGMAELARDAVG